MATNFSNNEHEYPFIIGNTKLLFFYQPSSNPNKAEFTYKKAYNKTQAIGGNTFEHWGKEPTSLHVEMRIVKSEYAGNRVGLNKQGIETLGFRDPLVTTEAMILQKLFEFDQRPIRNLAEEEETSTILKVASNPIAYAAGAAKGVANSLINKTPVKDLVNEDTLSQKVTNFSKAFSDTIIYYKDNIYSGFFDNFKIVEDGSTPFYNSVVFDFIITSSMQDAVNEWLAQSTTGRVIIGVLGGVSAATTLTAIVDSATSSIPNLLGNQIKI